jgi:uncharacterized protein with HEPN domain
MPRDSSASFAYFGVDLDIVWDVVSNKLPLLERRIREIAGS